MKKNRFNFDKKILEMLDNLDLIPKTQTDPLPGVGGRLFIITKSQQNYFKQSSLENIQLGKNDTLCYLDINMFSIRSKMKNL